MQCFLTKNDWLFDSSVIFLKPKLSRTCKSNNKGLEQLPKLGLQKAKLLCHLVEFGYYVGSKDRIGMRIVSICGR